SKSGLAHSTIYKFYYRQTKPRESTLEKIRTWVDNEKKKQKGKEFPI
ncbi:6015_t:CDS:1, partial [Gigaspora rosea]